MTTRLATLERRRPLQGALLMIASLTALTALGCKEGNTTRPDDATPTATATSETSAPPRTSETTAQAEPEKPPKKKAARYEKVALAEIARLAAKATAHTTGSLGDSEANPIPQSLAHDAFKGPVGTLDEAYVYVPDAGFMGGNPGIWIMAEVDGAWHAWRANLELSGVSEINAIFFEDLGMDGDVDVFVLYTYMPGAGPQAAHEFREVVAFDLDSSTHSVKANGEFFEREEPKDAAEVRAVLRQKKLIAPASEK